ncbi:MAG: molecular chaperone TorD family protein [Thioploca sp.]|nr:molecular chaperone TorD family protein [Thioploca sp.]
MLPNNITPDKLRLFAGLLASPSKDSLAVLIELTIENLWLQPAVVELQQMALDYWQAEHTRLFINGHPQTCCPPFQSVYRHGVMNGAICEDIERFYQSIGLETIDGLPPDYLGVLLECAAYLAEQQPVDVEQWQQLWQNHIVPWVPRFAEDLQSHSELILYQQLGVKLKELF